MRWLLLKDLQILRRSPLLVALLVAYPVVIALLIGLALSRGPDKPKVAFVNEVAAERADVRRSAASAIDAARYADELFDAVDPVPRRTRAEALEKVRSGEVLGALIVPRGRRPQRLQDGAQPARRGRAADARGRLQRRGPAQGRSIVESTIKARLADANQALSRRAHQARRALPGHPAARRRASRSSGADVRRPRAASAPSAILRDGAARGCRAGSRGGARACSRVADFARLAIDNLDLVATRCSTPSASRSRVKRTVARAARARRWTPSRWPSR